MQKRAGVVAAKSPSQLDQCVGPRGLEIEIDAPAGTLGERRDAPGRPERKTVEVFNGQPLECDGVPGTQVAARNPVVGTTQLTSATSVDPPASLIANGSTSREALSGGRLSPSVVRIFSANARSSAV